VSRDRLAALSALSILRDRELGQQLRAMLDDQSSAIRARVAFHLGRQRSRDTIPAIETLMQDDNPAVRSAARRAYCHGRAYRCDICPEGEGEGRTGRQQEMRAIA